MLVWLSFVLLFLRCYCGWCRGGGGAAPTAVFAAFLAKTEFVNTGAAKQLQDMGFTLFATKSTHEHMTKQGIACSLVYKPLIKREPNVLTMLQTGKIDMVIDVPDSMESWQAKNADSNALTDGFKMRRGAIEAGVSLITDIKTVPGMGSVRDPG
eukprot:Skav221267  [mRNA]  locus=scaffold1935:69287:70671:- [translate_table: standard]